MVHLAGHEIHQHCFWDFSKTLRQSAPNRTNSAGFTKSFETAPCSRHRKITWALTMTVTRTLFKRCNWRVRKVKHRAHKLQNYRNKKKSCQLLLNLETRKEQQVLRCVTWEETDLQGRSCCGAAYEETDQTQTRFSNIGRLHHIFCSLKHL